MKEIRIETPHASVYGRAAGERGASLVLGLHGYSQDNGWQTWEPLMPPLAAAGFWVVSIDMPGWGQSRLKSGAVGEAATAVLSILDILDCLRVEDVEMSVLMGKSWGGGIALEFALQYPDWVSKLILTAPARRNFDPLQDLRQPVLLAWAKDDPVIPYAASQKYVDHIPMIQLESYETGGHSAAQKNVADFAPKAIKFLQE